MNFAAIIFLIPIAGIALGAFSVWLKHKEKIASLPGGDQENAQLFDEVIEQLDHVTQENKSMKRRLEILEAIVTDESFDQVIEKKNQPALEIPTLEERAQPSGQSPRVQRRTKG